MFMKKTLKKIIAGAMALTFLGTAFPVTEMVAKAAETAKTVNTEPIYYWYRPQNSDDIPKDTTFRILIIDQVSPATFEFRDQSMEFYGGKEYYYLSKNYTRLGNNFEMSVTHLSGDVKYQIDFGADEFFTVGDLNTPYARRLKEVTKGTERDADGYTGWIDGSMYKRHKSINSSNVEENSPLIRLSSTEKGFSRTRNCYQMMYWNANTAVITDFATINSRLQNEYQYMFGQTDIFEFVVNPKDPAGENKAYTQENSYLSHIMNAGTKNNAGDMDEALYFSYFNQNVWNAETASISSYIKKVTSSYANQGYYNVYNIPSEVSGPHWTWQRKGNVQQFLYYDEYSAFLKNPTTLGILRASTADLTNEIEFRNRKTSDTRDGFTRPALTNGLLKLPKIYIGVPNRGISEMKPNNGSSNTYTVPEKGTELIANNTYLRADRKLVVNKGCTLVISGWLILHGELEVNGGTVIVDSGGAIVYLDRDANQNNAFGKDIILKNCTFIIMDGGKVVANRIEMNNSNIINYGLFMSNWDSRSNSNIEFRRYSTGYESVSRVYPSCRLSNNKFIETNKDNGYPKELTIERGSSYPGNGGISGNTSRIIVSDMANKYNVHSDSTFQHIKSETYYEKQ